MTLYAVDDHHLFPRGCAIISPGQINKPPIILVIISETCTYSFMKTPITALTYHIIVALAVLMAKSSKPEKLYLID